MKKNFISITDLRIKDLENLIIAWMAKGKNGVANVSIDSFKYDTGYYEELDDEYFNYDWVVVNWHNDEKSGVMSLEWDCENGEFCTSYEKDLIQYFKGKED